MTRLGICLTGGGISGAAFQIGALAALHDAGVRGFDVHVGVGAGASVAAGLACGASVERLYRAFLDPADDYFSLERRHILDLDTEALGRAGAALVRALRHGAASFVGKAPVPASVLEELDRLYDVLPPGLFSLEAYEQFFGECLFRRGLPSGFSALATTLLLPAYDIDSGERIVFGRAPLAHVPIPRAVCAASAMPLFHTPVQVGDRFFLSGTTGAVAHVDVALSAGAESVLVLNPLVTHKLGGAVPTGHGRRRSLRDKGMMAIFDQAIRIAATRRFDERIGLLGDAASRVVVLSADPSFASLFLASPGDTKSRRELLEHAYRTTRDRVPELLHDHPEFARGGG